MLDLDRGEFLKLGAGGLVAAAATGIAAPAANATLPPTPRDDDVAYLSFATAAESASRDVYLAAYEQAGTGLTAARRRHINRVASAKRDHIARLKMALGADAPQSSDFVTVLPHGAVKTAARIVALGEQLETLLVRVYLTGVGFASDPATRLFMGRLMAYDAEQLAWLHGVSGHSAPGGLLSPIDLGPASDALDAFVSTPDFPD